MRTPQLHALSGALATLTVATFWTSTLISEVFLSREAVVAVKHAIALYGLVPMALFMALAAATGQRLSQGGARQGRLLDEKRRRMAALRRNGLLLMVPLALFLNWKAGAAEFDRVFYAAQLAELLLGLSQLSLLARNLHAGLRLAGRLRASAR